MPRRTPKPFVVEIRSSGRRKAPAPFKTELEQPRVEWPAAMMEELRAEPEPSKPSGRVLPALDALPPAPPPPIEEEPETASEPVAAAIVELVTEPVALENLPQAVPPKSAFRQQRLRRQRTDFKRGERWKARLPAAVHRSWWFHPHA